MKKLLLAIVIVCALNQCAGVSNLKTVKIDSKNNSFTLNVPKRLHEVRMKPQSSLKDDYLVEASAMNIGSRSVNSFYMKYTKEDLLAKRLITPSISKNIIILPGESKVFYRGPLSMLWICFSGAPFDGGEFLIKIDTDPHPHEPIILKLSGTWGGP